LIGCETLKTFWNKATDSNDIYIYGDITSYAWDDADTTAKKFVDDLNSFGGGKVTVHLNSGGGDVFTALAINNAMRGYKGGVVVSIDGVAASAASLIAMAGKPTKMAANALMMIHEPAVGLYDFYDAAALAKVQASLEAVHGAIVETYASRIEAKDAERLMTAETWLSAKEAKEMGLVDEITAAVPLQVDDAQRKIFVNSLAIDVHNFDGIKIRQALGGNFVSKQQESKNNDIVTEKVAETQAEEPKPETKTMSAPEIKALILKQERQRVRDLKALKCENAAVNAIIDVAIDDGRAVKDIQAYVDALKNLPASTAQNAADKIVDVIRDQMTSGAEGISGSQDAPNPMELQAKKIAEFANGMI